jgi:hypothetical protein
LLSGIDSLVDPAPAGQRHGQLSRGGLRGPFRQLADVFQRGLDAYAP